MASDYSRTCVSPDSIQTGEAPVVSETCEVYVWGSNSSHQLVEGTQEKILQPKLAACFADAQTVRRSRRRSRKIPSGFRIYLQNLGIYKYNGVKSGKSSCYEFGDIDCGWWLSWRHTTGSIECIFHVFLLIFSIFQYL